MSKIRFNYKLAGGRMEPIIPIGVKLGDYWQRIEAYVDSGATYTVLQASVADEVGFSYRNGQPVSLRVGNGSLIRVFLHDLEIQLGSDRFISRVGFSDQLRVSVSVLGKVGLFDRFDICFQQAKGFITFENATNSITED